MSDDFVTPLDAVPRCLGYFFVKGAADAVLSYGLAGRLYLSSSGWLLLSVPNSFIRGCFQALSENGAELPRRSDGTLNAHISVMRPEEIEQIGGADKITERGKLFRYTLGPVRDVNPAGWEEMERCWFVEVNSPELSQLRRSYGLSSLPNNDKYKFHITFAVRRKGVLRNTDVVKESEENYSHEYNQLEQLLKAKQESDRKNYAAKRKILEDLLKKYPEEFTVDQPNRSMPGITHKPTNFKLHTYPDLAAKATG